MKLKVLLLLGVLIATASLAQANSVYDEIVEARKLWDEEVGFNDAGSGVRLVDDGKAYLDDLDVAVPIPCVVKTGEDAMEGVLDVENKPLRICSDEELSTRSKRNIASWAKSWGTFEIPYTIDTSKFSSSEMRNINGGIAEYEKYTCIKFVRSKGNEPKIIDIVREGGCWSYIGNIGSRQKLSLAKGCAYSKGTPIHEFFHALGSWHQQSRPDRDKYIEILTQNVQSNRLSQFKKHTDVKLYNTAYSFTSVMHYPDWAFRKSSGLKTIKVKAPYQAYQSKLGNRVTFSFEDLQVINRHFKCDTVVGKCPSNNPCASNQYRGKDCKCYCKNGNNINVPAIPCPTQPGGKKCGTLADPLADELAEDYNRECDALESECQCSAKGEDACSGMPNSYCDEDTDACMCRPGMKPGFSGRDCSPYKKPFFISDGSSLSPFVSDATEPKQFAAVQGPESSTTFGVKKNGYVLHVNGTDDSEQAVLIVPPVSRDDSLEDIKLCVDYNENNLDAVLHVRSRASPTSNWQGFGFPPENDLDAGAISRSLTLRVPKASEFEMEIVARPHTHRSGQYWEVNVDPLLIYRCD